MKRWIELKQSDIDERLERHRLWLSTGGRRGCRASLAGARHLEMSLVAVDLSWVVMRDVDLRLANLCHARLASTNLRRAILAHAELYLADLSCADIRGADLVGANLDDATLVGCRVDAGAIASSKYPLSWWLERGAVVADDRQ